MYKRGPLLKVDIFDKFVAGLCMHRLQTRDSTLQLCSTALERCHAYHSRLAICGTRLCILERGEIVCQSTQDILNKSVRSANLVNVLLFNDRRRLRDSAPQDVTLDKVWERHFQLVANELFGRDREDLCDTRQ